MLAPFRRFTMRALLFALTLVAVLTVACGGDDGKLHSKNGIASGTSFQRHVIAGSLDDANFSCGLAEISLARSRINAEVKDWILLIDPCYDLKAGDLTSARARLREIMP